MAIFLRAEGIEGIAVAAVDGRTGQPEEEGIGQRGAHLHAQVALLGAVRLVDHDDNVVPLVEHAVRLGEFEDGRDDDLARVLAQQLLQLGAGLRLDQVGDVRGVERGADLRIQVDAVHDDDHGGRTQSRLQPQLLRGEDHEQRLARPLKVPDQPLARRALDHTLHDLVGGVVLLVAADDLEAALLLVGGEEGEVCQDIQDDVRAQQGLNRLADVAQAGGRQIFVCAPGTPQFDRHADSAVV